MYYLKQLLSVSYPDDKLTAFLESFVIQMTNTQCALTFVCNSDDNGPDRASKDSGQGTIIQDLPSKSVTVEKYATILANRELPETSSVTCGIDEKVDTEWCRLTDISSDAECQTHNKLTSKTRLSGDQSRDSTSKKDLTEAR